MNGLTAYANAFAAQTDLGVLQGLAAFVQHEGQAMTIEEFARRYPSTVSVQTLAIIKRWSRGSSWSRPGSQLRLPRPGRQIRAGR